MIRRVQKTMVRHDLLRSGTHVLAAVSGGADSVALLHVLHALAPKLEFGLTVAHLDHRIRGAAAREDARFVDELCAELCVPCVCGRADVPRQARARGVSLEMAARRARYRFFARTATQVGADVAATAHTADDQAETVLLKLARGAGASGLSGIAPRVALHGLLVVRPLLDVTRRDVLAYLRRHAWTWREDESNRDISYQRNRVRHEVLPLLEACLNPALRPALARTADVLREEDAFLDQTAVEVHAACAAVDGSLDVGALAARPLAMRRRVVRRWLAARGVPAEGVGFECVERVDDLLCGRGGTGLAGLPGPWRARRCYGRLLIEREGNPAAAVAFRQRVACPGETVVAGVGLRVVVSRARGITRERGRMPGALPARCSIGRAALGRRHLVVRAWRAGDRMAPLGLSGTKKVQDIFVDAKVPAEQRLDVPLFVCGDEVVWMPGYRIARGWEVKGPADEALHITVERSG